MDSPPSVAVLVALELPSSSSWAIQAVQAAPEGACPLDLGAGGAYAGRQVGVAGDDEQVPGRVVGRHHASDLVVGRVGAGRGGEADLDPGLEHARPPVEDDRQLLSLRVG